MRLRSLHAAIAIAALTWACDDAGGGARPDSSAPAHSQAGGATDGGTDPAASPSHISTSAGDPLPVCVPRGQQNPSDEFPLPVCPDASLPPPSRCEPDEFAKGACQDASAPSAAPDASADAAVDAGTAPSCASGPELVRPETCENNAHQWQSGSVQCQIRDGLIAVTGQVCEACGRSDANVFLNQLIADVTDCNGCPITGSSFIINPDITPSTFSAGQCRAATDYYPDFGHPVTNVVNSPNRGALAGKPLPCADVYVAIHSTSNPECDPACQTSRNLSGRRVCRCNVDEGTCVTCPDGKCP